MTINPKINDDKFFQCRVSSALNYQNTENHPERISTITSFIDNYKWTEIIYSSHPKDWKKLEPNQLVNQLILMLCLQKW